MEVDAVIARARSAIGTGVRYKLGKGGMQPGSPTPAAGGQCDCSGFVAWCFYMSRKTDQRFYVNYNNGWLETTAIWTDVDATTGIFDPVTPRRGAIVVMPDKNGGQGHIGILSSAAKVIHCSKGNDRNFGDAIHETDLSMFRADRRFGWLVGLH